MFRPTFPAWAMTVLVVVFTFFLHSCGDPCDDINCINGGACNDGTCVCPDGFSGEFCQDFDPCFATTCLNGGTCVNGDCDCPDGYEGDNCEDEVVTDPCADVVCQNGGTCIDGDCACNPGYEGEACELLTRDRFIDTWVGTDDCSASGTSASYNIVITAGSNHDGVLVSGIWDTSFINSAAGTVNENTLDIPMQDPDNDGFILSATAVLNGNTLTWTYTVTQGGADDQCTNVSTRQ